MSQDDFDTMTGTWDPYYGAIPPNNHTTITVNPNNFSHPTWTTTGTSGSWTISDTQLTSPESAKLQLKGENADIEINGRSLSQVLDGIEQRLGLIKYHEAFEKEWHELKELGDRYREKLKFIEEQVKMWETLKK